MQPSPPKRCTLTADLVLELGQLNKGESIHALRGWLVSVEDGCIRRRQLEDHENEASCLNLVTNAIITWNTVYIAEVLRRLRAEGHQVNDDAIAHLSPDMYAHVNKHGKYRFDVDRLQAGQLRPLRQPTMGTLRVGFCSVANGHQPK